MGYYSVAVFPMREDGKSEDAIREVTIKRTGAATELGRAIVGAIESYEGDTPVFEVTIEAREATR